MERSGELKAYLAGAALANAPVLVLNYLILSSISLSGVSSSILSYGVCLASSAAAGCLVARRLSKNCLKAGAVTGPLSYIIYTTVVTALFPAGTWDLAAFLGFLMGGCVGSKAWEMRAGG